MTSLVALPPNSPDALIVATGIASQVAHLVTNDAAWAKKLSVLKDRIGVVTIGQFLVS